MRFSVIAPTLNAGNIWQDWIRAIKDQSITADEILIIDSGSTDDTVKQSLAAGFQVKEIRKHDFGHGRTRQMAVEMLSDNNEVLVFLTQDAILHDEKSIENLLKPFSDSNVAAVCGRQLPRKGAKNIEAHARLTSYPPYSYDRTIADADKYGLKTAFMSNSFAAYKITELNEVGGFPADVIFGEDMYVTVKLLKAGYKIAYSADACVYHSHEYSLWQEMRRYFDMGVFHAREPWIRHELGGAEGEGIRFVVSELIYLLKNAAWQVPEGIFRTSLRYTGFRLGLMESRLPQWLKIKMAMNKGYFRG
jgi:rhamnosyltransferase